MTFLSSENVVNIPPVSTNTPANPLLGYSGSRTAPPSEASSTTTATQSTLANRLLLYDQRCLVTGAVSNQLQACHLVNAIRVDSLFKPEKREEKLATKKKVVRSLPFLTLR